MSDIATNIKTLRKERGLSQEAFAQNLHVTRQTISAWERGLSQPGLDTLQQIALVLEVEVDRVLYGGGGRSAPRYRYQGVSYWPVLGVVPLFYFLVFWVLPIPMSWVVGIFNDTAAVLCGQLFLAILGMFCYCSLKDEIRNRDYHDQTEPEEEAQSGGEG